jgi:type I restriction enzyme S subunit
MELKHGYKQTEVGLIPQKWELLPLGQLVEHTKGFAFRADDYCSHGIRILRVSDTTYNGIKEGEGIYLDFAKADSFRNWALREGDLVVSTVGSKPPLYDSMVGKATFIESEDSGALLNQNAVILRSRKWSLALQRLLHNHLRQNRYLTHIERIFRGNANQASITLKELFEYQIPLPPTKAEQEAIAEALSDADSLIESLEQLLAKKRLIKQGAMQELLIGKRRLTGFKRDWEVKRFGELFQFLPTANSPRSHFSDFGRIGYIHYGDIHTSKSAFLDCASARLPLIEESKVTGLPFLEDGDLVMADASEDYAGIGKSVEVLQVSGRKIVAGLHTFLLRGLKERFADGFKGYLQFIPSVKAQLIKLATGISVYGVSKNNVRTVEVSLPAPPEQKAIAAILSDMDAEITALEAKLAKLRSLEQGMMQELLTGKIRLV